MLLNFLKTLETLMEIPEFIIENGELGSFVRRREWSEKRESKQSDIIQEFLGLPVLYGNSYILYIK